MLGAVLGGIGSIGSSIIGNMFAKDAADQAWNRQKKLAQKAVQWRVNDAVAAGLHPLAAHGMSPSAPGPSPAQVFAPDLGQMGADLGRAIEQSSSGTERVQTQQIRLQLENGQLQNDLLRAQIASQRIRNAREVSPPVSPGGKVFFNGTDMAVGLPGGAQNAEDHYGNIIGDITGIANAVNDVIKYSYGSGPYDWVRSLNSAYKSSPLPGYDKKLGDMYKAVVRPNMGGPRNRYRYNYR